MDIDLTQLTEAELVALNHRVVERIKLLRQSRSNVSMARFNLGDRVSFQPECGHVVVGTVVRLNQKSASCFLDYLCKRSASRLDQRDSAGHCFE